MKLDEFVKFKSQLRKSDLDYVTKVKALKMKAKNEGLFKIRLGDYVEALCEKLGISRDELDVNVAMFIVIEGDASRLPTIKIYDGDKRFKDQKIYTVYLNSKNKEVPFATQITVPFTLLNHTLADGSKFRSNLIIEKEKTEGSKPKTYSTLTFKQENAENLIMDLTSAYFNGMDKKARETLIAFIKKREREEELAKVTKNDRTKN